MPNDKDSIISVQRGDVGARIFLVKNLLDRLVPVLVVNSLLAGILTKRISEVRNRAIVVDSMDAEI